MVPLQLAPNGNSKLGFSHDLRGEHGSELSDWDESMVLGIESWDIMQWMGQRNPAPSKGWFETLKIYCYKPAFSTGAGFFPSTL